MQLKEEVGSECNAGGKQDPPPKEHTWQNVSFTWRTGLRALQDTDLQQSFQQMRTSQVVGRREKQERLEDAKRHQFGSAKST